MTLVEQRPEMDFTQEIRFAIVMYGGISLAIYMNGVAQELRKMVRATAPSKDDGCAALADGALRPNDTEVVYRELGRMLYWGRPAGEPAEPKDGEPTCPRPIRTRFVVDILSGSSAGGINAVYLAKALANDQPMDELKDLWTEEGDMGVLINDKASIAGTNLDRQVPPRSLLNGMRMYWKLLDALDGMDKAPREEGLGQARNVEELDLYVTATDMSGRPVELQLADMPVKEYRHRNVFHFRYDDGYDDDGHDDNGHNDFLAPDNPFLAFAARCTSAHPAAFEPMRFGDVDEVLGIHSSYAEDPDARAGSQRWRHFFKEYLRRGNGDPGDFLQRDFNDGGVLDNRPFRHATDAIPLHRADVPVSRKLVYLDPAPERLRIGPRNERRPNVAENAWASLSTLPRYEPIQEDLQRVLDRNRLIERVNTIVEGMEERDFVDYERAEKERQKSRERQAFYTDEEWDRTTLSDMVGERGLAWAGYQHLRVTEVTDELALLLTRVAGFDTDSDEFRAVRHLVRCWRERHFSPDDTEDNKLTEHAFLRRFDVGWRLRRLKFVLGKIDRMLDAHPERARDLASQAGQRYLKDSDPRLFEKEFQETLSCIRRKLDRVRTGLRRSKAQLWEAGEYRRLREAIGFEIKEKELKELLRSQREGVLNERVRIQVEAYEDGFERFGELVCECIDPALRAASLQVRKLLPPPPRKGYTDRAASGKEIAVRAVRFHYDDFANYDMISHPILYSTGVGEEMAPVDVFRISPEDAPFLIKEELDKPKLAGTKLNNFGAFFEKKFRTNDILWGRLDGAERIITALLPTDKDKGKREELIERAHCAIIDEEVFGKEPKEPPSSPACDPAVPSTRDTLNRFREKYHNEYEATREFDPQRTTRSAARASRVVGDLLEGYAETQRRLPKGGVVWFTRIAQLFWLLVEVAVPNSLASLVFRHGLQLLYFFEALAILLGTLLLYPTIQQFGFVAFAATAAVHGAVLFLEDAMSKKERGSGQRGGEKRWRSLAKYVIATLVALSATLGLIFVFAMLGLDLPQRFVGFMTGLPETANEAGPVATDRPETTSGTILRGAVMFVAVAVFLLATGRGISRRIKR